MTVVQTCALPICIEGSRLSQEQTQHIFQTKSFTTGENEYIKIDDILETINHFKLFDLVIDNAEIELSEELIKQFQSVLKQGTSSTRVIGDYKQMKNYVGNIKTATPTQVKPMMKKLLGEYNSKESVTIEDIIDFHYQFETIHPFEDGNGRVGRIIMFKECLKHNIMPFILKDEFKAYYYRGLKEYKNTKGYLVDTCKAEQDNFEEIFNEYVNELDWLENS